MAYAAIGISVLALGFTIGSFWWLHARSGALTVSIPRTYAFADKPRLRLALVFFNTGARALIVDDLRVVIDGQPDRPALGWITTRSVLRPEPDDGFAFATPFAVVGRGTREVVAEFGNDVAWAPIPCSRHRLRLQARLHPSEHWRDLAIFDWWAPPSEEVMKSYIAHRNESPPNDDQD
jgi:hypothetical protein